MPDSNAVGEAAVSSFAKSPNKNSTSPSAVQRPAYLTKQEIAAHFKVESRTIDNWMKKWLPYRKFGGAVRFKLEEVEAYAEEFCRIARPSLSRNGGVR